MFKYLASISCDRGLLFQAIIKTKKDLIKELSQAKNDEEISAINWRVLFDENNAAEFMPERYKDMPYIPRRIVFLSILQESKKIISGWDDDAIRPRKIGRQENNAKDN